MSCVLFYKTLSIPWIFGAVFSANVTYITNPHSYQSSLKSMWSLHSISHHCFNNISHETPYPTLSYFSHLLVFYLKSFPKMFPEACKNRCKYYKINYKWVKKLTQRTKIRRRVIYLLPVISSFHVHVCVCVFAHTHIYVYIYLFLNSTAGSP